jgi:hypothetical protein
LPDGVPPAEQEGIAMAKGQMRKTKEAKKPKKDKKAAVAATGAAAATKKK